MRSAVAILTITPSPIWMDFLSRFTEYDVYIVCDCNRYDYNALWGVTYPRIRFVQMSDSDASDSGFSNMNTLIFPKRIVTAWEKAVYYFSSSSSSTQTYDHVWLIEEDVFFHHEKTLLDIDLQYKDDDLLTAPITSKNHDRTQPWYWHWPLIEIVHPEPHYRAMVCAIRVSRSLLGFVHEYAQRNGRLFFLEALFPTVARHHGLRSSEPTELSTVLWLRDWGIEELDRVHLYHPMKNLTEQRDARTIERF